MAVGPPDDEPDSAGPRVPACPRPPSRRLAPAGDFAAERRVETEVGYGLRGPHGIGLVTPYTGLSLGEGGGRAWRTGARWQLAPEATFGLEATRKEAEGAASPVTALELRGQVRW